MDEVKATSGDSTACEKKRVVINQLIKQANEHRERNEREEEFYTSEKRRERDDEILRSIVLI